MFIYNVTIKINAPIKEAWLHWLKEEHIPEMIQTGCFTDAVILHLVEADDEEGFTFAVQYHVPGKALYNRYIEKYAEQMRKKGIEKWGDQFIAFRTLMQVVN